MRRPAYAWRAFSYQEASERGSLEAGGVAQVDLSSSVVWVRRAGEGAIKGRDYVERGERDRKT